MFWVINTDLMREGGYADLIAQLDRQGIEYQLVRKPPMADFLVSMEDEYNEDGHNIPIMLDITGPVFVCGTTSMAEVSKSHGWLPGYLSAPSQTECIEHWGEHMLNRDSYFDSIANIVPPPGEFFIRPNQDSKSFAGTIMNDIDFEDWRRGLLSVKSWTTIPSTTVVMISSLKTIHAEYRCTVVDGRIVTASQYKIGDTVKYSNQVDQRIIDYATMRADEWNPEIAYTLDIADTSDGLRIIETNSISSSGFYALDMNKFVGSITALADRYR